MRWERCGGIKLIYSRSEFNFIKLNSAIIDSYHRIFVSSDIHIIRYSKMDLLRALDADQLNSLTTQQLNMYLAYDDMMSMSSFDADVDKMKDFIVDCAGGKFDILSYLEFQYLLKKHEKNKFYLVTRATMVQSPDSDDDEECMREEVAYQLIADDEMSTICPIIDDLVGLYLFVDNIYLYCNNENEYVSLQYVATANGYKDDEFGLRYQFGSQGHMHANLFVINDIVLTVYEKAMNAARAKKEVAAESSGV